MDRKGEVLNTNLWEVFKSRLYNVMGVTKQSNEAERVTKKRETE